MTTNELIAATYQILFAGYPLADALDAAITDAQCKHLHDSSFAAPTLSTARAAARELAKRADMPATHAVVCFAGDLFAGPMSELEVTYTEVPPGGARVPLSDLSHSMARGWYRAS